MQDLISTRLKKVTFGPPQIHRNLTVVPLVDGDDSEVEYITMGAAMRRQLLTVTEVSEQGSVPHLKVVNHAPELVLLLDGEELVGARQNRVLNTSVLLAARQEVVIPVSCTEAGRWAYRTRSAEDSKVVMPARFRGRKSCSVSNSLASRMSYESDQCDVWNCISELSDAADVDSETGAMSDVYEAHREALDAAEQVFPLVPGQVGVLALVDGKTAGLDLVSRTDAYGELHSRLVRSYVMDGLVSKQEQREPALDAALAEAREFLDRVMAAEGSQYRSVGLGEDLRLRGERVAGSALIVERAVIHVACFAVDENDEKESGSGFELEI